jgi:hypothetical protein
MVLDLRLLNIAEFLAGAYPKPSLETAFKVTLDSRSWAVRGR